MSAGAVHEIVGVALATVTLTMAEVVCWLMVSRARAESW